MIRFSLRTAKLVTTFALVLAASFLIDRTTKKAALSLMRLSPGASDSVPFFSFALHKNSGLAFSILADSPMAALVVSVAAVLALAVLAIYLALRAPRPLCRRGVSGLAMMLGGAAGNAADRLTHGFVVDWFYLGVFINAADLFLCVGCLLVAIDLGYAYFGWDWEDMG